MLKRRIRLTAMLALVVMLLQCTAPALALQERSIQMSGLAVQEKAVQRRIDDVTDWILGFNRTPNAVRTRFNRLSAEFSRQGARIKVPVLARMFSEENSSHFSLYQTEENTPIASGSALFRLNGLTKSDGKVDRLTLNIAPSGSAGNAYLNACDQLMRVTMFSLFDKLSERVVRDATTMFIYDVWPFGSSDDGKKLTYKSRSMTTVIDNTVLHLSANVNAKGAIRFEIRVGGSASNEQSNQASANNLCNRNLTQTNTECADLLACVQDLSKLVAMKIPNWSSINAVARQLSESLSVLDELSTKLNGQPKSRAYAAKLKKNHTALVLLNDSLSAYAKKRAVGELVEIMPDMLGNAAAMQALFAQSWR